MTIRKYISLFLAALMALSLAACGGSGAASATEAVTTAATEAVTKASETAAAAASAAASETEETTANQPAEAETKAQAAPEIFSEMDGTVFGFMSGVGAWETMLTVYEDGSFDGEFYDMNMGETGEDHEDGTIYECFFKGKFAVPEAADELTYVSKVEELDYEVKEQYIEESVLHIPTSPYGLSKDDEVTIYLPGTKVADLSEEFMSWAYLALPEDPEETLEIMLKVGADDFCFFPDHYAMGDSDVFYTGQAWESEWAKNMRGAYEDQKMPGEEFIPYVYTEDIPAEPYESVTLANLQGSWVNVYNENGSVYTEILTVNGRYGKIRTLRDGNVYGVWNGEGLCSIEDRSAEGKCPAFRIFLEDGSNLCTIYIRWVNGNEFYDGGFLNSWYFVEEDEPDDWLFDTVTLDNLEGVWYSEIIDDSGYTQTALIIEDGEATLFETVNGVPTSYWNGKGPASVETSSQHIPMLSISFTEGVSKGGTAGIYITVVDEDMFFDEGSRRHFMRVY